MISVTRLKGESLDKIMKRFKGGISKAGIIKSIRTLMYYEKPSVLAKKQKSLGSYKQKKISDAL